MNSISYILVGIQIEISIDIGFTNLCALIILGTNQRKEETTYQKTIECIYVIHERDAG